ncbi:MAG TPA: hypothetical protein VGL81_31530 [Polyangiaceae bacterium]|jgi:hypothetical protein
MVWTASAPTSTSTTSTAHEGEGVALRSPGGRDDLEDRQGARRGARHRPAALLVEKGAVLHLDYEQGEYITRERYQRLSWGQKVLFVIDMGDKELEAERAVFVQPRTKDKDAAISLVTDDAFVSTMDEMMQ